MKKIVVFLSVVVLVFAVTKNMLYGKTSNKADNFKEIYKSFTWKNKPIHPKLIEKFSGWYSDSAEPVVTSVDILQSFKARNEYDMESVNKKGNTVCYNRGEREGYFCYNYLGHLNNGLCVVQVFDNGGGSGVFGELYFVYFTQDKAINREGKPYKRILMNVALRGILGDRNDCSIHLNAKKNRVKFDCKKTIPSGEDRSAVLEFKKEKQGYVLIKKKGSLQ